jgi:phosphatidylethanolamine/phosphatidyl-N-methylethanolamine N-methyltransferase
MGAHFDRDAITKAYGHWAPIYDLVFGEVFARGRAAAVTAAERIGGHILEVGVGTGISLPHYSRANRVVGLDISEPMLRRARAKIREHGLDHVEGLAVMDAAHLAFPGGTFDVIVGQYLITAVPDPEATLDEFFRVLKPNGEVVLVNHLSAQEGTRRVFERGFAPIARRLGWQPDFGWERLAHWLERRGDIHLLERRAVSPLGHFSLIRFGRSAASI